MRIVAIFLTYLLWEPVIPIPRIPATLLTMNPIMAAIVRYADEATVEKANHSPQPAG